MPSPLDCAVSQAMDVKGLEGVLLDEHFHDDIENCSEGSDDCVILLDTEDSNENVPDYSQERNATNYLSQYCSKHDWLCPGFFDGSLSAVCDTAFQPSNGEALPVLVYIHHQNASFTKQFLSRIFFSESMIEYLLNNYMVWPYIITPASNADQLTDTWQTMFGHRFFDQCSTENFPMLIGIGRCTPEEKPWFSPPDHRYQVLMKGNILTRTRKEVTLKDLLHELQVFKRKFDQNEKHLSFNFRERTGLTWDVILKISEYLTLNDAVNAFSPDIIPEIKKSRMSIQVSNSPEIFISMIAEHLDLSYIRSLRLDFLQLQSTTDFNFYGPFWNIPHLELVNFPNLDAVKRCLHRLFEIRHLSFSFDNESMVHQLFREDLELRIHARYLRVRSPGVQCYHAMDAVGDLGMAVRGSFRWVNNFFLDLDYYLLPSSDDCALYHERCFLQWLTTVIQTMPSLHAFELRLTSHHVQKLFFPDLWETIFNGCSSLMRIVVRVLEATDRQTLIDQASSIEQQLQNVRAGTIFRLKFV